MPIASKPWQGRGLSLPYSVFCGPTVSSDIHSYLPKLRVLPPGPVPCVISQLADPPHISLLSSMETGERGDLRGRARRPSLRLPEIVAHSEP